MDEGLVDIVSVVTAFTFVFLVKKLVVGFDISLSTDYAWSLSITTFPTFF